MSKPNSSVKPVRVPKPWGHELIFARTRRYVGKVLHIRKGRRLSLQFHKKKDESILVVDGKLHLTYGRNPKRLATRVLKPGQTFHVTPRLIHRFRALETCSLFEVSTPELWDVVRLQDDYGRGGSA
ncbi:MAG: cupin domain-containing protein [Nitrospirae bacterium]|nr:cupin domain-containing protein [Nitrospirota bacterium]